MDDSAKHCLAVVFCLFFMFILLLNVLRSGSCRIRVVGILALVRFLSHNRSPRNQCARLVRRPTPVIESLLYTSCSNGGFSDRCSTKANTEQRYTCTTEEERVSSTMRVIVPPVSQLFDVNDRDVGGSELGFLM